MPEPYIPKVNDYVIWDKGNMVKMKDGFISMMMLTLP